MIESISLRYARAGFRNLGIEILLRLPNDPVLHSWLWHHTSSDSIYAVDEEINNLVSKGAVTAGPGGTVAITRYGLRLRDIASDRLFDAVQREGGQ